MTNCANTIIDSQNNIIKKRRNNAKYKTIESPILHLKNISRSLVQFVQIETYFCMHYVVCTLILFLI